MPGSSPSHRQQAVAKFNPYQTSAEFGSVLNACNGRETYVWNVEQSNQMSGTHIEELTIHRIGGTRYVEHLPTTADR
jgi:hypothetical protein